MIKPHIIQTGADKVQSDHNKQTGHGYTESGYDHKTEEFTELLQLAANQSDNGLSPENGYTGHWESPDHVISDILPPSITKAQKYAQAYQIAPYQPTYAQLAAIGWKA